MITRRTNTYASAERVPPSCHEIDGRPVPLALRALFRRLWRTRGQWHSLPSLQVALDLHNDAEIKRRLEALDRFLVPHSVVIDGRQRRDEETLLFVVEEFRLVTADLPPDARPAPPPAAEEPEIVSLEELEEKAWPR